MATTWRFSIVLTLALGLLACEVLQPVEQDAKKSDPSPSLTSADGVRADVDKSPPPPKEPEFSPSKLTRRPDGTLAYRQPKGLFVALIDEEGKVAFVDPQVALGLRQHDPSIFHFVGPAEWTQRLRGESHASEKLAFLQQSQDYRTGLATNVSKRRVQAAADDLAQQLQQLWRDQAQPSARRRETLFKLWDECEEQTPGRDGPDPLAHERAQVGERARRRIEAFVREAAPKGSPLAFSANELAKLNGRRRSQQVFDPYTLHPTHAGGN